MLNDPILGTTRNCINLQQIKREMGEPPWARQVVLLDHVVATAICQPPGTINDRHVHDYDEWWVVMEGEIDWVIEGRGRDRPRARRRLHLRSRAHLPSYLSQG